MANQPEARLDAAGDPRVGMAGGSYGGGIQLVTAGLDKRVDAIVPDIAWQSLVTSLYKDQNLKMGWGTLLTAAGNATGRLDGRINSAFTQGSTTGRIPEPERQWFESRGPGAALVDKIRIPTMLTQGTVDTLFTLREAEANYRILKRNKRAGEDDVALRRPRHLRLPRRRARPRRGRDAEVVRPLPEAQHRRPTPAPGSSGSTTRAPGTPPPATR